MKAGSMEGLIGAGVNMEISRTPMRVYKEAERRGDTAVMERAMGYVADFQKKAHACSDRAQEELAKELKEERKEQETRREQALARKEKAEAYVEKIRKNHQPDEPETDSVEISEEGKEVLKNNPQTQMPARTAGNKDVKMYTGEGRPTITGQVSTSATKTMDFTV